MFNPIPVEQTTAATDLIMGTVAVVIAVSVYSLGRPKDKTRALVWTSLFVLSAVASFLGAIAHGFAMSAETHYLLWQPLNLSLGLSIALFVAAVVYDVKGRAALTIVLPLMLVISVFFYLYTLLKSDSFLVFIAFEVAAMLLALICYFVLAYRQQLAGAWTLTLGILINIIAGAVQSLSSLHFTLIWEFNHNGLFHEIQMASLIVLYLGLRKDFKITEKADNCSNLPHSQFY